MWVGPKELVISAMTVRVELTQLWDHCLYFYISYDCKGGTYTTLGSLLSVGEAGSPTDVIGFTTIVLSLLIAHRVGGAGVN